MLHEEFPYKLVMVDFPLEEAKISLITGIEDYKQSFQHYHEAVEQGREKFVIESRLERLKNGGIWLQAICRALLPIFGKELRDKVYEATNHYYVEKINIAALDEVIAELKERFPPSACYK